MVAIAQLAEHRIVVPSVVGSSPTSHPKKDDFGRLFFVISGLAKKPIKGSPKRFLFGESEMSRLPQLRSSSL